MRVLAALVVLLVATAGVYAGVAGHDYVLTDDPTYVIMNPWVSAGLTRTGVLWAFTSFHAFNWHPLTWLSHMTDVELLGAGPRGPHLVNVGLHVLDTLLVFVALRRLTGRDWESLLVAALFALHPAHVESVAWISERKDVLSTFFSLLTLWAWAVYAARPGVLRYLLVALLFAAGLMSKPMVVTLPFVLLLLDAWPLRRVAWTDGRRWLRLVAEKAPLLVLSGGASVLTMLAQKPGLEWGPESLPLAARLGSAVVAYVRYLQLTAWPVGLAAFYPHPGWVPLWQIVLSAALLAGISWLALRERERRPYLLVGWLWFLGMLVPVIGLVQVGQQALADRYTYLPHVGLFVAVVWGASDLVRELRVSRAVVAVVAVAALGVLAGLTRAQAALWENSQTLYEHALAVTEDNYFAHYGLATMLLFEDRREEARRHLLEAVSIQPSFAEALNALGNLALEDGREDEALDLYRRAAASGSYLFEAQINAGSLLEARGDLDAALPYYQAAARLEPYHAGVHYLLGSAYEQRGALRLAVVHYGRALQAAPDLSEAREGLRRVRARLAKAAGRRGDAPGAGPRPRPGTPAGPPGTR